jgi:hypothetical protein
MYYGETHIWGPLVRKVHEIRENNGRGGRGGSEGGNFMWTEPRQPEQTQSYKKWTGWFNK